MKSSPSPATRARPGFTGWRTHIVALRPAVRRRMQTARYGVLALLLGAATTSEAAMILQTDTFAGHTYHLIADDMGARQTWADAQAAALGLGGNLVTVDNAAENAFLLSVFGPTAVSNAPLDGGLISLWLGFSDTATEGAFVWVDGSPVTYTNWKPGEPAGGVADEDFAGLLVQSIFGLAGEWHDVVSDFRANDVTFGVVEIVPTVVPEPGVLALAGLGLFALGATRKRPSIRLKN